MKFENSPLETSTFLQAFESQGSQNDCKITKFNRFWKRATRAIYAKGLLVIRFVINPQRLSRLESNWISPKSNPGCLQLFPFAARSSRLVRAKMWLSFAASMCVYCGFYLNTSCFTLESNESFNFSQRVKRKASDSVRRPPDVFLLLRLQFVLAVPTWRWMYYKPRSRLWLSFSWMAFSIDWLSLPGLGRAEDVTEKSD